MLLNINKMDLFHAFAKLELPFMLYENYRAILGDFDNRPMFEDYVFDTTNAESIYQLIIDRILADPNELRIIVPAISCETDDLPWEEMLEEFFIQKSQFPGEMEFCAAVCAVSHEMAGTSYNGLADRIKPQLVDEAQYHRLLAVRAAEYDIKVLKIYDDHVRNVDNLAPYENSGIHYSRCVQEKLSGVRSD